MTTAEKFRLLQEAYGWEIVFPDHFADAERQRQLCAVTWDEIVTELGNGHLEALKARQQDLEESLAEVYSKVVDGP